MINLAKERLSAFQKLLKQAGLSGYITLAGLEQRYFSGIDLSDGEAVFLITPTRAFCITKEMIASKVGPAGKLISIEVSTGDMFAGAVDKACELKLKKVGFDPALIDFTRGELLDNAGFVRCEGFVSELRSVKYKDEAAHIAKACRIAADAFDEVKPAIKTGMTEEQVRILIALAMTKRGAESIPFNIICFGENGADAHHTPSRTRKLKSNEPILMDFGCLYEGYTSDMTRSWWHGAKPSALYNKIHQLVAQAKEAAEKAIKPGVFCTVVDAKARDIISSAGYGAQFFHTTGHSIGLEVHEAPILSPRAIGSLEEGNVVTVEPGIYLSGQFGVRLEDSYLVTKTGSKNLTKNSKQGR